MFLDLCGGVNGSHVSWLVLRDVSDVHHVIIRFLRLNSQFLTGAGERLVQVFI